MSAEFQTQIDTLQGKIGAMGSADINYYETARRWVELPQRLSAGWSRATDPEKAMILKMMVSNSTTQNGNADIVLLSPFEFLRKTQKNNLVVESGWKSNLLEIISANHHVIDGLWGRLVA